MADALADYIKPTYPREQEAEYGLTTTIQYVGPESVLQPAKPAVGTAWSGYLGTVASSEYEPLPRSNVVGAVNYGELTIIVQRNYDPGETIGTPKEITYEIDWVPVERSLLEHPEFRTGGTFALTDSHRIQIEAWRKEKDDTAKALFQFWPRNKDGVATTSSPITLATSPAKFCLYLSQGVEVYVDYAPVARKTTTFVGGPPPSSEAGQKISPTGFPNLPTGYEWRKSADRHIRAGGQTRWSKSEEWQGAIKVLVDKDQLFL